MGSHASFLIRGEVDPDTALATARRWYPRLVKRVEAWGGADPTSVPGFLDPIEERRRIQAVYTDICGAASLLRAAQRRLDRELDPTLEGLIQQTEALQAKYLARLEPLLKAAPLQKD
jgi:hypothetical protein